MVRDFIADLDEAGSARERADEIVREHAQVERKWGALGGLESSLDPIADYPLHSRLTPLSAYIEMTAHVSGAILPICGLICLGIAASNVQSRFDVSALGHAVRPISLMTMGIVRSGRRKSAAHNFALERMNEVESEEHAGWRGAHADWDYMSKKQQDQFLEEGGERPSDYMPNRIIRDGTAEGIEMMIGNGRKSLLLADPEAAAFFGNWSNKGDQLMKSFSTYSKFWDGEVHTVVRKRDAMQLYLENYRVSAAWCIQRVYGEQIIGSLAASTGFAARVLTARDDGGPGRLIHVIPDDRWDQVFDAWQDAVRGIEVGRRSSESGVRRLIVPDGDALAALQDFHDEEAALKIDKFEMLDDDLLASYWGRAPEQAARIAAVDVALNALAHPRHDEEVRIDADTMQWGIAVAKFHGRELQRIIETAERTELADAIRRLAPLIVEFHLMGTSEKQGAMQVVRGGAVSIRQLMNRRASGSWAKKRSDPEFRERIIEVMERENMIQLAPDMNGRYYPHPELIAMHGKREDGTAI